MHYLRRLVIFFGVLLSLSFNLHAASPPDAGQLLKEQQPPRVSSTISNS